MNKKFFLLFFSIILLSISLISAADLTVSSGTSVTLGGNQEYGIILVENNATINVNSTQGWLNLTATTSISIYGTINGDKLSGNAGGGAGACGPQNNGNGPGAGVAGTASGCGAAENAGGGGGGSHRGSGGTGGAGPSSGGAAGSTYGNITDRILDIVNDKGSGGGAGASANPSFGSNAGEDGGAAIELKSPIVFINGTISTDGGVGGSQQGNSPDIAGGGGASGGTILINGLSVDITNATFTVTGGSGGNCFNTAGSDAGGGAGAGGGLIKIFYTSSLDNSSLVSSLSGGSGTAGCGTGSTGGNGNIGTIYFEQTSGSDFNTAPTIHINETIPNTPALADENVYINITTSDADNDAIDSVFFWVTLPNSTILIDGINGTFIDGDSSLGQNETWQSPFFNITNQTGNIGTWSWNFTIVSNGTNANTTSAGSFVITDSSLPNINITSPLNNSVIYQNVSIPVNFTTSDNVEIDSCWRTIDESATNTTIPGCNDFTFEALNQTINMTIWVNDTSNNVNSYTLSNITLVFDTISPVTNITSPVGTVSSKTFDVIIDVTDLGGASYCEFNITRGASTEVVTTQIPNCVSLSTTVSADADYLITIFVNDSTGNFNITSSNFTVDTTASPASTGGDSGTTTIFGGLATFDMMTTQGGDSYQFNMIKGSSRTRDLVFENLGSTSLNIKLSCEGDLCDYTSFEKDEFDLPIGQDIKTNIRMIIDLPENFAEGEYVTNIIALDQSNNRDLITVTVNTELGIVGEITTKLTSSRMIGNISVPYFFIFLFCAILIGAIGLFGILKPLKFLEGWAILIGLIGGFGSLLIF